MTQWQDGLASMASASQQDSRPLGGHWQGYVTCMGNLLPVPDAPSVSHWPPSRHLGPPLSATEGLTAESQHSPPTWSPSRTARNGEALKRNRCLPAGGFYEGPSSFAVEMRNPKLVSAQEHQPPWVSSTAILFGCPVSEGPEGPGGRSAGLQ